MEDEMVVVFAELQLMAAGMTGGVQVGDEVQVVHDVGDDVALHHLLVIDVVDHLHERVADLEENVKALDGRPQVIAGMVDERVERLDHQGYAAVL